MCPFYFSYYHYIEYSLIVILTFNVLYYVAKVLTISLIKFEPITITEEQKKLLGVDESGIITTKKKHIIYIFIFRSILHHKNSSKKS